MIQRNIAHRLREAIARTIPDAPPLHAQVRPCPDPRFGDYQNTGLLTLAKERKLNPREIAASVASNLDVAEWCEPPEIAGPGFLNFRLRPEAIARALESALRGEPSLFARTESPKTVVIDFSSPNAAKPMHVGHIRSTNLGDSLSRILRLLGHRVITDNHLGDWGTQFGMLLVGWKTIRDPDALAADPLGEMERIYKRISAQCDAKQTSFNPEILDQARSELVKLQAGDPVNLGIWQEMIRLSQSQFNSVYSRLGVKFDFTLGESFYNPRLQTVVDELMSRGIAVESQGAKAVLSDGSVPPKDDPFLIQKEGEWVANPFIIQKTDGGFNYGTTDLATVLHRVQTWNATEIIYVTDGRQQLHFKQLFAAFKRWHPEVNVRLVHAWFGSILGEDGKPFKTRSGETVKLLDLLDEAEQRAMNLMLERNPTIPPAQRQEIARVIGIGAIKYADLLPNRQSDYVFSWEKMLALQGNTVPYLQYAYTRTRSLFRKAGESEPASDEFKGRPIELSAPEEIRLAKQLLNFGIVLEGVIEEYRPNFLCNYLYDLAGLFARFWENCPILKAEEPDRSSRLALSHLTGQVLKQGLDLLGIETTDTM